jgi:hypothetical protein
MASNIPRMDDLVPLVAGSVMEQPSSPNRSTLWQWTGFQNSLHETERRYLNELHLGDPKLVQEFNVCDEGGSGGLSTCVLFPKVLLLFREQHESAHLHFESGHSVHHADGVPSKWSVYAVIFPRHVSNIVPKPNGTQNYPLEDRVNAVV